MALYQLELGGRAKSCHLDLRAKTALSPEQDKYVGIFRRADDNRLNLINDILDLSKVEASQLELEQTSFSLHDHLAKSNSRRPSTACCSTKPVIVSPRCMPLRTAAATTIMCQRG